MTTIIIYREIYAIVSFFENPKKKNFFDFLSIIIDSRANEENLFFLINLKAYQNKQLINWIKYSTVSKYNEKIVQLNDDLYKTFESNVQLLEAKINLYLTKMRYAINLFRNNELTYNLNNQTYMDISNKLKDKRQKLQRDQNILQQRKKTLQKKLHESINNKIYNYLGEFLYFSKNYKIKFINTKLYKSSTVRPNQKITEYNFIGQLMNSFQNNKMFTPILIRQLIINNNKLFLELYKFFLLLNIRVFDNDEKKEIVQNCCTLFNSNYNLSLYAKRENNINDLRLMLKICLILLFRPFFMFYNIRNNNTKIKLNCEGNCNKPFNIHK